VEIELPENPASGGAIQAQADPEALRRLRQKALNHPAVAEALDLLDGDIAEIRPLPGGAPR
jgi:hypothetical protein